MRSVAYFLQILACMSADDVIDSIALYGTSFTYSNEDLRKYHKYCILKHASCSQLFTPSQLQGMQQDSSKNTFFVIVHQFIENLWGAWTNKTDG